MRWATVRPAVAFAVSANGANYDSLGRSPYPDEGLGFSRTAIPKPQRGELRTVALIAYICCFLALSLNAGEVIGPLPELRLQNLSEWHADESDIRAVLKSTSSVLWQYFPGRKLPPIEISARGGPISLYQRGPNGEVRVKLNTGKEYWSQYAYQWAHEFCHVLCGLKEQTNPNHWFEESLCEMSSMFCLRAMAKSWQTHPPYRNWKSYSASLQTYADERLTHGFLTEEKTFVEWFAENEDDMRKNSVDRERNSKVACVLLPLFEAEPEHWEAVVDLNTERFNKLFTFKQYLEAWRRNTAERHRAFIDKIAAAFKLRLEIH